MPTHEITLAPKSVFTGARAALQHAVVLLALGTLAACESVPSGGPCPDTFEKARWEYVTDTAAPEGEKQVPFALVDADRKVIAALADAEDRSYFKGAFTDRSPPANMALGVGDVLRITIFEAGSGGLFTPVGSGAVGGGNFITLPDQEVDQTGRISVPYADKNGDRGVIKVAGRQPVEVQNDIQDRLLNKAIEPQVIITFVKRNSNQYSVIGDVGAPGRYSLTQSGVRILDAISAAGGPKGNDYNTLISLQRGKTNASARLSTLLRGGENNIFVQPSDLTAVKSESRYYNVLGATKNNSRVAFEAESVTVADALAKAGGLDNNLAEPQTVVVMRRETPNVLGALGLTPENDGLEDGIPTVYRFDLSQPSGIFLAQQMKLRNNDILYVANHPYSDVSKLFSIVRDILLIRLIND